MMDNGITLRRIELRQNLTRNSYMQLHENSVFHIQSALVAFTMDDLEIHINHTLREDV